MATSTTQQGAAAVATYKILGINDDKDFCGCCGKKGIKRVVWIENEQTGEVTHFGTTCAASPEKALGLDKELKAAIRKHDDAQKLYWCRVNAEYRRRGGRHVPIGNGRFTPDNPELRAAIAAELK